MKKKVYYHDTDAGGVVYYANYLKYMEEARTECLAERGISVKELAEGGVLFVVAHQEIDYKLPAFYGDVLEVETKFVKIGAVKMEVEHAIKNQKGEVVCFNKTVLVCVDKDIKPLVIPEVIRQKFQ